MKNILIYSPLILSCIPGDAPVIEKSIAVWLTHFPYCIVSVMVSRNEIDFAQIGRHTNFSYDKTVVSLKIDNSSMALSM